MRLIKFRIWLEFQKKMIELKSYYLNTILCFDEVIPYNHIMQFTGKYDSKGKMIYEDDIIECTNGERYVYGDIAPKKIIKKTLFAPGIQQGWEETIIGNIYENPELLKD